MVLKKTLESPLGCKEIKPVYSKGNQSWIFIGRKDAEAEAPILWPPDAKRRLIGKDTDAGKDWRQEEEEGMTEDEMVGCHHWLSGHEFEQTQWDSEGQGSLVCCSSCGCKQSDMTEWLNNNKGLERIKWVKKIRHWGSKKKKKHTLALNKWLLNIMIPLTPLRHIYLSIYLFWMKILWLKWEGFTKA